MIDYLLQSCMGFETQILNYEKQTPDIIGLDLLNKIESSELINMTFAADPEK